MSLIFYAFGALKLERKVKLGFAIEIEHAGFESIAANMIAVCVGRVLMQI